MIAAVVLVDAESAAENAKGGACPQAQLRCEQHMSERLVTPCRKAQPAMAHPVFQTSSAHAEGYR